MTSRSSFSRVQTSIPMPLDNLAADLARISLGLALLATAAGRLLSSSPSPFAEVTAEASVGLLLLSGLCPWLGLAALVDQRWHLALLTQDPGGIREKYQESLPYKYRMFQGLEEYEKSSRISSHKTPLFFLFI